MTLSLIKNDPLPSKLRQPAKLKPSSMQFSDAIVQNNAVFPYISPVQVSCISKICKLDASSQRVFGLRLLQEENVRIDDVFLFGDAPVDSDHQDQAILSFCVLSQNVVFSIDDALSPGAVKSAREKLFLCR